MGISSVSSSGLDVQARRIEASANNLANASTEGFRTTEIRSTEVKVGGARAEVLPGRAGTAPIDGGPAPSGTDLVEEIVNQSSAVAAYRANAAVVRTADEAEKDLIKTLA